MHCKFPHVHLRALPALLTLVWLAVTAMPRAHAQPAPNITQQPQPQSVILGSNATFTVTATGQTPFTYQWTFNSAPLSDGGRVSGALTGALTISNVQPADAGGYAVTVFDRQGDPTPSTEAQLTVLVPPSFLIDPGGVTYPVVQGSNLTVTATAAGSQPISAQWFFGEMPLTNGPDVGGATSLALTLSNVPTSFEGPYRLMLSNVAGSATSQVAVVDVLVPPVIIQQPENLAVFAGSNATFNVSATGDPLSFRWAKNGVLLNNGGRLSGVLTSNLTIASTVEGDSGDYSVFLYGVTTNQSVAATLAVRTLPVFVQQPASKIVIASTALSLTAVATNALPLSFQWLFNGTPLADGGRVSGAATTNLLITPAEMNDSGAYQFVASNIVGAVTSAVANVSVGYPPVITTQPLDQAKPTADTTEFLVTATGSETLAYRWFRNGGLLSDDARRSGTTTPVLTISNLMTGDSGSYSAVVTNLFGAATSSVALLTVLDPPQITVQPRGRSVPDGLENIFTASSTGGAPLSRQWQFNGADIPGANGVNFTNPAVTPADVGDYRLVVSNAVGAVTSLVAQLTIGPVAQWGTTSRPPPPGLSNVVSIAAGLNYSLALHSDGSLTAWGINPATNIPPGLDPLVAVAAGTNHAVGLRPDGTVVAWGENSLGQTNVPASLSNVVAVAAGANYSAALRREGIVIVWGGGTATNVPVGLDRVVSLGAGLFHLLALNSDNSIARWGSGMATDAPSDLTNAVELAGGYEHSIARRADGRIRVWGNPTTSSSIRTPPFSITDAIGVAAGPWGESRSGFSLVLRSNGTVTAWGGVLAGSPTNVPPGLSNVVAITGGYAHALALVHNGPPLLLQPPVGGTFYTGAELLLRARAVGAPPLTYQWLKDGNPLPDAGTETLALSGLTFADTGSYQLVVSNASGVVQSVPAVVTINDSAPAIYSQPQPRIAYFGSPWSLSAPAEGSRPMTFHWTHDGAPVGGNTNLFSYARGLPEHRGGYVLVASNAFGSSTSSVASVGFAKVATWGRFHPLTNPPADFSNAVGVAAGKSHVALLRPDRSVSVWGTNLNSLPGGPPGLTSVSAISAGNGFTVALRDDGTVTAWATAGGQFAQTNVPPGLTGIAAVDAGMLHVLGLRSNGTVVAWGDSDFGRTAIPDGLSNVVAISAGVSQSLALKDDGTVVGWGFTSVPAGLTNVVAVVAGYQFSLAIRSDGSVVGWEGGAAAAPPASLSNILAAASGGDVAENTGFSVALRQDGSLATWGFNTAGSGRTQTPADLLSAIDLSVGQYFGAALLGDRSPAFTVQPWSRRVGSGAAVTFAAFAAGEPPLQYQWFKDGAPLVGETNRTLTFSAVTRSDKGWYHAHVSNGLGAADSRAARLEIGGTLEWLSIGPGTDGESLLFGVRDSFGADLSPGDLPALKIQASTNLLDWVTIPALLDLNNGLLQLLDPDATHYPFRFYRVVEEE